jgi:tRNA (guanine-N7-)-methyltransferase
MSQRQDRLLAELLPALRLPLGTPAPLPLASLFAPPVTDIWLEIGFGSGEHLLWQAEQHPEIGLIGCEPFLNGVASLLGRIEAMGVNTVRIHDGDAREVLGWLPKDSLGRIFLLFPDPWPKKRHAKRRLLSPETVTQLAQSLRSGGEIRFATDSADYAGEALRAMLASPELEWTAASAKDCHIRPQDWPETRYERKALARGGKPSYLSFRRR